MQMTPEALVRHQQTRINEIQQELAIVTRERDRAKELSDRMVEQSRMHLEKRDAAEARARENSERGQRLVAERKELKTRIDEAKAEALEAQAQLVEAQKQLATARDNLWAAEDRIVVLKALLKTTQAQKEAALRRLRELTPRHVPAAQDMTVLRVTGGYSLGTPSFQFQLGVGVTHNVTRNTRMYRPSFTIQINPPSGAFGRFLRGQVTRNKYSVGYGQFGLFSKNRAVSTEVGYGPIRFATSVENPRSIFGSRELCQNVLNSDIRVGFGFESLVRRKMYFEPRLFMAKTSTPNKADQLRGAYADSVSQAPFAAISVQPPSQPLRVSGARGMYAALIGLVGAGVLVVVALWKRFWNKK